MGILKAGLLYFAIVFGAGFVLGPARLFWLVPRFGERTAELMEMPVMIAVIVAAAPWVIRKLAVPPDRRSRVLMGAFAMALLLGAEISLVVLLRGQSIASYLATRDPVSGTAYYLSVLFFGVQPAFAARDK